MSEWPLEIADREVIVRGICSPYHVNRKGKLQWRAYAATPGTDEVSVIRADWVGADECKRRAKSLEDPNVKPPKVYAGFAVLNRVEIRAAGADVQDSRHVYPGHSDIKLGLIEIGGDPLPPEELETLRDRQKMLANSARYLSDPSPGGENWSGLPLK